ncbi:hypothetical protein JCM10212_006581 [Sporobolomyces blumeae]
MTYTPLAVGAGAGALAWVVRTGANDLVGDWWSGWAIAAALCFLAYLTNPNPASFRTHLTSLSFHTHLRRLSSSSPSRLSDAHASTATNGSGQNASTSSNAQQTSVSSSVTKRKGVHPQARSSSSSASAPAGGGPSSSPAAAGDSRHVLSFSNRISLSIRTPSHKFTSYHLFSTVYVPSARPHSHALGLNSSSSKKSPQPQRPSLKSVELNALLGFGGELWLGVFGRWYALKWWETEEIEEEERRARLEQGVRDIVVEDNVRDFPSFPTSTYPSTAPHTSSPLSQDATRGPSTPVGQSTPPQSPSSSSTPANRSISVGKRIFRAGQRRSSPTSLSRLKNKVETAAREKDEANESNAANDNKVPSDVRPEPDANGSTLSKPTSPKRSDAANTRDDSGVPDPVLVELQLQLEELRTTTAESEKRLHDELEVLRGKKKDEDAFRAELKVKTKGLEEAKRAADASRTEAEKELNERKGAVKEVQKRIEKLRGEIAKLERKELEQVERKEKKKRERREREKKLADDVGKKKDELKEREKGLEEVMQKVNEMEKKLDIRRALLATRRNELAQLAGAVAARNGLGGPPLYGMPPQPTTSTLGGVGSVANAFAVPFGQGAYGRRNYPYVHPLSATSSRPTSIRSGHYDPHTGTFQSAPSSPTLSHPLSPLDDPTPYNLQPLADQNGGWPSSYPAAAHSTSSTLPQTGFLEHRLQHRAAGGALPSADDVPSHFLPFDLDHMASQDGAMATGDDHSPGVNSNQAKPRTLALPMQYLDSGLLAGSQSPGVDGPLSPMTPHQASLIPSQLFQLLDDDDNDDFVMPDSPTLRSHFGSLSDWKGLGLDVDDLGARPAGSRRSSDDDKAKEKPESVAAASKEVDEFHEARDVDEDDAAHPAAPSIVNSRADLFPASGTYSATTSPLGPPPASPFGPWDNSSPTLSTLPPPPGLSTEHTGVIGSTILHRLSPSHDLSDGLPRAGLSLNPDAKAFSFPFSQQPHARTSSVPSPAAVSATLAGAQVARSGRSASSATASSFPGGVAGSASSALPSPTVASYPSPIEPPSKSRMEFASASDAPLSARFTPPFDWPRSGESPKFSPAPGGSGSPAATSGGNGGAGGFNPFDEEDSLLGPLRK